MSIHREGEKLWRVRWREGGRNRSVRVRGPHDLARKVERKKMSARDENRHLEVRREINFRMTSLLDLYEREYAVGKKSYDRERAVLNGIRQEFRGKFVREIDAAAIKRWYDSLINPRGLKEGTALRHFTVMRHMMGKAATIWSAETGIERNPASGVEVRRPDDARDRFLSATEIRSLNKALEAKAASEERRVRNVFRRLRLIVLIALTTGMRMGEIFRLSWTDVDFETGLIAVRARLKNGKLRFVPMAPELAAQFERYTRADGELTFPPKSGAKGERQRVERSFRTILHLAAISNFRFHDLRHTFASWYMMNGGDLYELAKILGHSNIKMTERYAKLGKAHIARTGATARRMWQLMED